MNKHSYDNQIRLSQMMGEYKLPETTFSQVAQDADALRRISMTLHRWHELECGTDAGCIEREQPWAIKHANNPGVWWDGGIGSDPAMWCRQSKRRTYDEFEKATMALPENGVWASTEVKPFLTRENGNGPRLRWPIPDDERGAQKRLARIMARYPGLTAYVQGDPRGAALYILRASDIPEGASIDSCYSRGVAVFK